MKNKEKQREYSKNHYRKNKKKYIQCLNGRRAKTRLFIEDLKSKMMCSVCKENDPACLDFHHINPNEKDKSLGGAIHSGWGKERLFKEIEKCIVLCSNCHRKLHYKINYGGITQRIEYGFSKPTV